MRKIKAQGLITQEPYSDIKFTEDGLCMAKKINKRNKNIYNFLLAHLNIEPTIAKNDTRRIERVISDSTLEYMKNYQ